MTQADQAAPDVREVSLYRRFIMGAGYLEGYGEHPGTEICLVLCLMTGFAGASAGGWVGFIGGFVFGVLAYGSIWASGCVGRANAYLRRQASLRAKGPGHEQ